MRNGCCARWGKWTELYKWGLLEKMINSMIILYDKICKTGWGDRWPTQQIRRRCLRPTNRFFICILHMKRTRWSMINDHWSCILHMRKVGVTALYVQITKNMHRKKRFTSFPSPAGMSLTKLPLGRNNSVMTSLFPPRESLVGTSRLGTGNSRTFFLRCDYMYCKYLAH